jgi:hypothetical protein
MGQAELDIVEELSELFPDADGMEDLDAADFKENADAIWSLVSRARRLLEDYIE